jgi:hypothetical protein
VKRLAAALLVAVATTAAGAESPRWGSFDLAGGQYRPNIDSEFVQKPGPYERAFGTGRSWMIRGGVSKSIFPRNPAGTLEVGLQAGYIWMSGKGEFPSGGRSGDTTKLRIFPTSLVLTYRLDFLPDRYRIPFAPYARLGLERFNWWVTDGNGHTTEKGATNGWSATGGVAFLLDIIDPDLAREMDNDTGINHTYIFGEITKRTVEDFGSSKSWRLSDEDFGYSFGLMFVF